MIRALLITCMCQMFVVNAFAQAQKMPPELAGLPDEIKSLKWQSIDMAAVPALEHCRALLLMDHLLQELAVNATTEADLMSSYLEKQNLGAQFASTPPPPAPGTLSYADAEKVAVALLRGPLNASYYATELADVPAATLTSYVQMYQRTCQRRWSEFDESRHLVRCMTSFLGNSEKLPDYEAWATAESARREAEYQAHAANSAAPQGTGKPQSDAQVQALQQQLQKTQQALAAAEYQQQSQAQQSQPQQQQGSQQATNAITQANPTAVAVPGGYIVPGGYGGYGYGYGYNTAGAAAAGAAAGATAANAANAQNHNITPAGAAAAGQYHGANSSWNRNPSYSSAARAQTSQRMSSFHGTPNAGGAHRR